MDKVALVTGADRGLGYGLVQSLLESGWHVVAGKYLDWPDLDALTERFPTELLVVPLDVSSDASVREAARIAGDRFGHLDVLISSAGILLPGNELGIRQSPPFDEIMSEFNVNALGGLRVVEAFLPMLDRGAWKRLCFVSSEAGSIAASKRTAWFGYCMSKAALNMAVKNLSNDLAPPRLQPPPISPRLDAHLHARRQRPPSPPRTQPSRHPRPRILPNPTHFRRPSDPLLGQHRDALVAERGRFVRIRTADHGPQTGCHAPAKEEALFAMRSVC